MAKMEIELTDEQMDKVKQLEDNGMSIGDAIDALFEVKDYVFEQSNNFVDKRLVDANREKEELEAKLNQVNDEISFITKIKDNSLDVYQKQKLLQKGYSDIETYDEAVQNSKHKFKWSKKIFKL